MTHVAPKPALLRVQISLVWSCVSATWTQNTQHLVSNSKYKKTSNKLNSCDDLMCNNPVFFSCRRPLTLRWVFPPVAAATTSGVAQLGDGFRARPSQNAEHNRRQRPSGAVWRGRRQQENMNIQSLNITQATTTYGRKTKQSNLVWCTSFVIHGQKTIRETEKKCKN